MRPAYDVSEALSTGPGPEKGLDLKAISLIVTHSFSEGLSTHGMLEGVVSPVLEHLRATGKHRHVYSMTTDGGEHYEDE